MFLYFQSKIDLSREVANNILKYHERKFHIKIGDFIKNGVNAIYKRYLLEVAVSSVILSIPVQPWAPRLYTF